MDNDIKIKLESYILGKIMKQSKPHLDTEVALISGGLIDSFSLVDLALFIEDEFGVHIDDSELNSNTFDTFEQLMSLIETRKK